MASAISPKSPALRIERLRDISTGKVGWYEQKPMDGHKVDASTARAIVVVYDALSPENRAKYIVMPVSRMAAFAWKNVAFGHARRRHPADRAARRAYHSHPAHPYSHPRSTRHKRG